ncbi:head maturation protease, ClpP-related [Vallitalea guaymasensis]|uniref:head maturation protease, ClpP-related n=1 Tax=Vallitalea guaymasensis TaxID=1185412 RepID=UPI000DE2CE72|nr:head maturation protease, ClpP-related [Vallitalea guaymasensis]
MIHKIEIKGAIIPDSQQWIYDWFDVPATSPGKVNKALAKATGEEVEIIMNSGGGSVWAGSEIYTSIKDYKWNTTGKIVGIAGSACSFIAMAVNKLLISPTAQIMIHNGKTIADGDKNQMNHVGNMLDTVDHGIANAYMIKTGINREELLELMNKETWLNAQQAKELRFVDAIMFEDEIKVAASIELDGNGLLPQAVIDKMRNELKGDLPINKDAKEELKNDIIGLAMANAKALMVKNKKYRI